MNLVGVFFNIFLWVLGSASSGLSSVESTPPSHLDLASHTVAAEPEADSVFIYGEPTITKQRELVWPLPDSRIGTLTSERLGIHLELYWSHDQEYVDAEGTAVMDYLGALPGDLSRHVAIGDHNYQTGKLFAQSATGDTLCITTNDGNFYYEYVGRQYGVYKSNAVIIPAEELDKRGFLPEESFSVDIIMDNGEYLFSSGWGDVKEDDGMLYIYTCYPLDAIKTDRRLIIQYRLVEGVQLTEKEKEHVTK